MKKRIVSLLLVLCIFISMLPAQAVGAAFSDTENTWAQKSIERLSTLGVISGSNGSFRPDQPITRAEVATIYSNLMGYRAQAANTFSDLSPSAWYYEAMLGSLPAFMFHEHTQHFLGYVDDTVGFIKIGVQIPQIDFWHGNTSVSVFGE